MGKSNKGIPRRQFLKKAAALATAGAVFPQIVPRHVVGGQGHTPPSETLYIAGIGAGMWGHINMMAADRAGAKIVALCDVDEENAAIAYNYFSDTTKYTDYRRLLEKEKGIDAIMIGTPDHTRAVVMKPAMELGKHIYCEKPLARTVYEVRLLTEAARQHNVAIQLGNQGHTYPTVDEFCECVWSGAIGEVREIHIQEAAYNYSNIDLLDTLKEDHPMPDKLDWDLWLGPAAYHDFHPRYHPLMWRGWSAFGTGMIGDWVCHLVDPVFTALDLGAPTSVVAEAEGFDPVKHGATFPKSSKMRFEFPARGERPPVTLHWYDGDKYAPPHPEELKEGEQAIPGYGRGTKPVGGLVVGDKGKIAYGAFGALNWRILSEDKMNEYMGDRTRAADPTGGGRPENIEHVRDWIEACKGWHPPASNLDYGGPLTEIGLLGNIALQMPGTELQWDAKHMTFPNQPTANQYLHYAYRDGWSL